jgi:hypothetical protein
MLSAKPPFRISRTEFWSVTTTSARTHRTIFLCSFLVDQVQDDISTISLLTSWCSGLWHLWSCRQTPRFRRKVRFLTSTLKMEAAYSSESATMQDYRCHNAEHSNLNNNNRQNFRICTISLLSRTLKNWLDIFFIAASFTRGLLRVSVALFQAILYR